MKKISRRDFLKGSAAIAATGLLGACGSQDVPSATSAAVDATTAAAAEADGRHELLKARCLLPQTSHQESLNDHRT